MTLVQRAASSKPEQATNKQTIERCL